MAMLNNQRVYKYIYTHTIYSNPTDTSISSLKSNAKGPHCDKARVFRTARLRDIKG